MSGGVPSALKLRVVGALVWETALVCALSWLWFAARGGQATADGVRWGFFSLWSRGTYLRVAGVWLAQLPVFVAHVLSISTQDDKAIGPTNALSRLARALSDTRVGMQLGALFGACLASGTGILLCVASSASPRGARQLSMGAELAATAHVAALLAAVYAARCIAVGSHAVGHTRVRRPRWFRLKAALPGVARTAVQLTAITAMLVAAIWPFCLHTPSLGLHAHLRRAIAWALGSTLAVCAWESGAVLLHIVLTEPMSFMDPMRPESAAPLIQGLRSRSSLIAHLAMRDLADVAEGGARTEARRIVFWEDESGAKAWSPVARACVEELSALAGALAAAVPAAAGGIAPTVPSVPRAKWNKLPKSMKRLGCIGAPQRAAAAHMRQRFERARLAARALSALCCTMAHEDHYGVLQLGAPNLGDASLALLSASLALQHYIRHTCSLPPAPAGPLGALLARITARPEPDVTSGLGTQSVDDAAAALNDALQLALYRMIDTFGEGLQTAPKAASLKAVYGSSSELSALLKSYLALKE